jgi:hypothetical protein
LPEDDPPWRIWYRRIRLAVLTTLFLLPPSYQVGLSSLEDPSLKISEAAQAGLLFSFPQDPQFETIEFLSRPAFAHNKSKTWLLPVGLGESEPIEIRTLKRPEKPDGLWGRLGLQPRVVSFFDFKIPISAPEDKDDEDDEPKRGPRTRMDQAIDIFESRVHDGLLQLSESIRETVTLAAKEKPDPNLECWQMPLRLGAVSRFGEPLDRKSESPRLRRGLTLRAPPGTQIRAVGPGTILATLDGPPGFKSIVVHHGGGLISKYINVQEFLAKPGDQVTAGQFVAVAGTIGRWEAPVIHFDVEWMGRILNPRALIALTAKNCPRDRTRSPSLPSTFRPAAPGI